jgi:hypothetical protein
MFEIDQADRRVRKGERRDWLVRGDATHVVPALAPWVAVDNDPSGFNVDHPILSQLEAGVEGSLQAKVGSQCRVGDFNNEMNLSWV